MDATRAETERLRRWRAELQGLTFTLHVPYYERLANGRPSPVIGLAVYPPRGVKPYTFAEALGLLQMFTQRWVDNGSLPRPELEPWAEEVLPLRSRRRRCQRFTLLQMEPRPEAWYSSDQDCHRDVA